MLWEIDILPRQGQPDRAAQRLAHAARQLQLADSLEVASARGFLLQSEDLSSEHLKILARELLADPVVETARFARLGDEALSAPPPTWTDKNGSTVELLHVLLKPGVMDPVAPSTEQAIADFGLPRPIVRTLRKYWLRGLQTQDLEQLRRRLLANDAIEQVVQGPLALDRIDLGRPYHFELRTVDLAGLDDAGLMALSRKRQLYMQLAELQTIQKHFAGLDRQPTDIELETLAQTWSEHCSHKTLAGRIAYQDERGERRFENMLHETIFAATKQLRERWGKQDWCVSVFRDNAGVVRFDDKFNVCFKVETHNHPSALEPYGGANTGLGGVIRDTLGTGMGAKPICSTDVFCFAPPDFESRIEDRVLSSQIPNPKSQIPNLPPGVLHPRRVMQGVVEGVRDYGNRMGIPTVNGAVFFDERYLGNPLVFCGNVGLLPRDKSFKEPLANDLIVAIGGRTGRDGIHGATFSSAELTHESEELSGGAVQIGNAIEEKKVADVLLTARDRGLFTAVTDCGAGGFSSAVGEMGEDIGAEVWLERAPLKYEGLSYTEIWISESQERMVLAVSEEKWSELEKLCHSEGVEATIIGRFMPSGRLVLKYHGESVGDLEMKYLHKGRPPVVREARYAPPPTAPLVLPDRIDYGNTLLRILGSLNVASKEWVIRQYDHEVQGGSVIKPLVGVTNDGPSDAAVVRPVLRSQRGIVIACGMNPRYGDFDTYHMAASAIDEAIRNCVAVGADPSRIALLDNFCWGDCQRPETLGSLVRAALACRDLSLVLETPFISGKDSLNNEFSYVDAKRNRVTIAIPSTLLISALGQVGNVSRCVTMDFKQPGSKLFIIGQTKAELGGSHFGLVQNLSGGQVPTVDPLAARATFAAVHSAIHAGLVAACHDLSEGGLAVAAAEMAFAGGFGAEIEVANMPVDREANHPAIRLFSESNTRFLCEVPSEKSREFGKLLADIPHAEIGRVTDTARLVVGDAGIAIINAGIDVLKKAWKAPLDW
ncbi:MAG: phosphoribosylformylglycinamidine synthase subunit PurL [Pirellulales bacterium]